MLRFQYMYRTSQAYKAFYIYASDYGISHHVSINVSYNHIHTRVSFSCKYFSELRHTLFYGLVILHIVQNETYRFDCIHNIYTFYGMSVGMLLFLNMQIVFGMWQVDIRLDRAEHGQKNQQKTHRSNISPDAQCVAVLLLSPHC